MEPDQASTAPPPPRPPNELRDRPLLLAGIVLLCSTPISGFVSYATAAILFGESRLEGSGGLTAAGLAIFLLPALLGVLLMLVSFATPKQPSRRTLGAMSAVASAALVGVGLWSALSAPSGDASIGGGLLILASLAFGVVAFLLLGAKHRPE